jgi:hypothetical protein
LIEGIMKLANLKLSHRFGVILATVVIGFAAYAAVSFRTLAEVEVNGPLYQRIVQGKDLVADILPPPEYILESYLVALQLAASPAAERKLLVDRLRELKRDYDTRHDYWLKEDLDAELKDQLLVRAHAPAVEFFRIALEGLVPALERGDTEAVARAQSAMRQCCPSPYFTAGLPRSFTLEGTLSRALGDRVKECGRVK